MKPKGNFLTCLSCILWLKEPFCPPFMKFEDTALLNRMEKQLDLPHYPPHSPPPSTHTLIRKKKKTVAALEITSTDSLLWKLPLETDLPQFGNKVSMGIIILDFRSDAEDRIWICDLAGRPEQFKSVWIPAELQQLTSHVLESCAVIGWRNHLTLHADDWMTLTQPEATSSNS